MKTTGFLIFSRSLLAVLWVGIIIGGYIFIQQEHIHQNESTIATWHQQLEREVAIIKSQAENWLKTRISPIDTLSSDSALREALSKDAKNDAIQKVFAEHAQAMMLSGVHGVSLINKNMEYVYQDTDAPEIAEIGQSNLITLTNLLTVNGPVDVAGKSTLLLVAPVQVEGESLAYVVGFVEASEAFERLFTTTQKGDADTYLITRRGTEIHYLTPLAKSDVEPKSDRNNVSLLATQIINGNRHYISGLDYAMRPSLAAAADITNTPWVLVHSTTKAHALASQEELWSHIEKGFWVAVILISIIKGGLWWLARQSMVREVHDDRTTITGRMKRQDALLDLISENAPNAMYIVNWDQEFCYINHIVAKRFGLSREEAVDRLITDVMTQEEAEPVLKGNRRAAATQSVVTERFEQRDEGTLVRAIQRAHIPIADIPMPDSDEHMPGVLITEVDITEYAEMNDRIRGTLQHVIDTLVQLVDQRDHHTAYHSKSVAFIAAGIGREMELDATLLEACVTAGRLMNIGKLFIPIDTLTASNIDEETRDQIRLSIQSSAKMLKGISFDGPVVETIEQMREHVDGSGPDGLKAGEILITARITAVANGFVAMTSPRAYREALSIDEAIKSLMEDIDKRYDRGTVAALVNFLDHRGGRHDWEALKQSHQAAQAS